MKKLFLLSAVVFAFVACGPKENKEAAATEDSTVVVDTVVSAPVDTTTVDTTVAPM
jgi:uncharacterized protein YcfL